MGEPLYFTSSTNRSVGFNICIRTIIAVIITICRNAAVNHLLFTDCPENDRSGHADTAGVPSYAARVRYISYNWLWVRTIPSALFIYSAWDWLLLLLLSSSYYHINICRMDAIEVETPEKTFIFAPDEVYLQHRMYWFSILTCINMPTPCCRWITLNTGARRCRSRVALTSHLNKNKEKWMRNNTTLYFYFAVVMMGLYILFLILRFVWISPLFCVLCRH